MSERIIILDQVDHRAFTKGQIDQRHFDLKEVRIVDLPPPTEQLNIEPSDMEQEFIPSMAHYFDKVVVHKVPKSTYVNITIPENIYSGEVEVQDDKD